MSVEGLVVSAIIALAFVAWLAMPLFAPSHAEESTQTGLDRQRERLEVYYERVLTNLHDLDEDYATGKLDKAEYEHDRALWVERGVQALKALEELDTEHLVAPVMADDATIDEAIDHAIETAVMRGQAT